MAFAFIVLNAVLLIRPEELYPEIAGLRLYLIVISLCLTTAAPKLAIQLSPHTLARRPITVCVLGLLVAVALSLIVCGRVDQATEFAPEFAKVVAYYLLLVSVVDTPSRLRTFIGWLVVFVAVIAVLGLLQYHEYVSIDAIKPIIDRRDNPETGETIEAVRMCSSGIFNDPNDLCLILVFGSVCCCYRATTAANRVTGALWLLPIAAFAYSLVCTQSRGGMLGLMAAVGGFLYAKFGWKRSAPILATCLVGLIAVGGRQAQLTGDTAHERLMLWANGISELFQRPTLLLTGLGAGQYENEVGLVAHNSYIHAYVELGLIGGGLFLAAFVYSVWMLLSLDRTATLGSSRSLTLCRPIVVAMVAGYCGGVYSLSRVYVVPTYLCLGLAASYLAMTMPALPPRFQVSPKWVGRTALIGVGGLAFLKLFTQYAGVLGL